jgi:hypothetical protein
MIEFIKKRKKIFIPVAVILVGIVLFLVFRPKGSGAADGYPGLANDRYGGQSQCQNRR